jgi:hypothetical protein
VGDRGEGALQCCNRLRCSVGRRRCRARVTGGALLGHGHVPGRDGRQGSSPAGLPGPAAWLPGAGDRRQERAAVLQLLGAPRWSAHPYLSAVVRDLIRQACCWAMAMSPGGTADRGHHLLGYPVRRPGPRGG